MNSESLRGVTLHRAVAGMILAPMLLLSACGGGGGGGGGGTRELGLGALQSSPLDFSSTPDSDARITFGTGTGHLPSRVDLRNLLPPVDSQLYAGSCVGWSTAYYLKTAVEKKEMGWDASSLAHQFSPAFIYNQRPDRSFLPPVNGGDPDSTRGGMQPIDAMNTFRNLGCCTWPSMPYDYLDSHTQPSGAAIAEAANYKARDYRRLGAANVAPPNVLTSTVMDEIRGWLNDEGTPVTIAINWAQNMGGYRGENNDVILDVGPLSQSGHMITIVGYDDNIPSSGRGSFLLVNSHGLMWGLNGFAWVPYDQLKNIYYEGYGVLDLPNTGPTPPPGPPQSNDTIAGAVALSPGSPVAGSIGDFATDPADWWKFSITAGSTATITVTGLSADVDVKLTDALENRLGSSENSFSTSETIVFTAGATGTLYVKVYPYDDVQSPYTVSLSIASGQGNDDPSGASPLLLNQDNLGAVGGSDPRDWWKMDLVAGQQVRLTMTGLSADIDLFLYRSSDLGGDWWLKSDAGGTTNELIAFTASASGSYYVLALPYAGASSTYTVRADLSSTADLSVVSWNVNYLDYSDRVEVTVVNLQVRNNGTSTSTPYTVSVGVSNGTWGGSSYWLGSASWTATTGLQAGWTHTWNSGTGTVYTSSLPYGYYYLLFMADSGGAMTEANEADNFGFSPYAFVTVP